jgi:hypothetical protein
MFAPTSELRGGQAGFLFSAMDLAKLTAGIYHRHPNYWILNGAGAYEDVAPPIIRLLLEQRLADMGFHAERHLIRDACLHICSHQSIDYALPFLPGFPLGLHTINGARILVPQALTLIQPQPGKSNMIDGILLALLGAEQLTYFKGWLQISYNCLNNYERMPGQVLILAGPQDCGKNLTQEQIITPVLGGRAAEPYRIAVSKTQFNQDLYKAAHLMIADQKNPADRTEMREFVRRMASNDFDSLHPKNKEAITLTVFWRMTISCNEQQADLKIIPPLDDLGNKLMLCRCSLAPMPMPTGNPQARAKFAAALRAELPAFIDSLLQFKIPANLYHERFGIKGYLHPELIHMVRQLDPEQEALELIRAAKLCSSTTKPIDLTAVTSAELHKSLFKVKNLRDQLLRTARSPVRLGQLLGRLADRHDGTVDFAKLFA